jgi:hypothetical protein
MPATESELLQGTLDLLILKTLRSEPRHRYEISQRIQRHSSAQVILFSIMSRSILFAFLLTLLLTTHAAGAQPLPPVKDLPKRGATLPDPLTMLDGTRITTADQWNSLRKPELRTLFQHYMYGYFPPAPEKIDFTVDTFQLFNDDVDKLPFDQHCLFALCAPRPILLSNAEGDQQADPPGQFDMLLAADPVYKLLGSPGLASKQSERHADLYTRVPPTGQLLDSPSAIFFAPATTP